METERLTKDVYVQSTCLQGENLAAYALWDKNKNLKVEVKIPKNSKVIVVNNAEISSQEGESLKLSKSDVNGYVGIILKTERIENPSYDAEIKFHFEDENNHEETVTKISHLFRPEVKVIEIPENMSVKVTDAAGITIENKLKLINSGEGLALIVLEVDEDSELKIGLPENLGSFVEGFSKDLNTALKAMASRYTKKASFINDYLALVSDSEATLSAELIKRLKDITERLEIAIETDEAFGEEFVIAFSNAFYRNINIITDFESLLTYVASITTKRIALMAPINTIKLSPGKKTLKGKLQIVDLGFNLFDAIPVKFNLETTLERELPIYKLFG